MGRSRRGRSVSMQYTRGRGRGPQLPDVHEERVRFWWAPPDRLREETTSNIEHQTRTVVWNGELWWLFGGVHDAITNELLDEEERASHGVGGGERFRSLLDPSGLSSSLEFDEITPGDGLLHVVARMRDDLDEPHMHHLHLNGGADRFELDVDAETGIVRATTSFVDGDELSSTRLEELALGETLDDALFTRPAGVEFEAPGGGPRQVTLEEAAAEAPFAVFYVPELPEGLWRLHVNRIRKPRHTVWLVYHRSDGRESFTVSQSAEAPGFELEGAVAVERDGTHLLLQSDGVEPDVLRSIAASLRRVSEERR